ncbi:translocon-associated protein subunit alpha-like [Mya arenaria]|uniref:translocon-associated protein subunit alpha-like n=1 Tax=Mya arenaria TaxID=6604 RepID=UPI0022E5FBB2|nr:translocon-associated protein subunit alpha-like [Mya arenaria]
MKSVLGRFLLLMLLVLPTTVMIFESGVGNKLVAYGDDAMEGEDVEDDDEATVETDDGAGDEDGQAVTESEKTEEGEDEEEEEGVLKPSPDAEATILFTKPVNTNDLPSGQVVRFLVGFKNNGDEHFTVTSMETSFRYPQDYSFYIQNFTSAVLNQVVEKSREATFEYGFTPSEAFNSRPFGLSILLNYKDGQGNEFQNAVFNETINVVEPDEGLDGETFFLYLFLVAIVVLLIFGAHQLLATFGKKHLGKGKSAPKVEMGTQKTDVDYSWLPQETLQEMNKSPKGSPRGGSPRKRKSKRGSGEE